MEANELTVFGGAFVSPRAPVSRKDTETLRAPCDPANVPVTWARLDGSVVLLSQTGSLSVRSSERVDRHADAFAKVWSRREVLVDLARESAAQSEA